MSIQNLLVNNNLSVFADSITLPQGGTPGYNRYSTSIPILYGTSFAGATSTSVLASVVFNRISNGSQPGLVVMNISFQADIIVSTAGYVFLSLTNTGYLIDAESIANTNQSTIILVNGVPKTANVQLNYLNQSIQISLPIDDTTYGYINKTATGSTSVIVGANCSSTGIVAAPISIIYQQAYE